MEIAELNWKFAETSHYEDDLLLEIRPGTVALLIRGRNAWHGTWVQHYLRNSTLFTDVRSAKSGAERRRGPGNVFYIREVPALHLLGASSNAVLCDAHPHDPFGAFAGFDQKPHTSRFGNWLGGLFPGVSMQDAVQAFRHDSGCWRGPTPDEHSLRTGRLPTEAALRLETGKLQSLVSSPLGSGFDLDWSADGAPRRYVRRGTNSVVRRWSRILEEAGVSSLERGDRAAKLNDSHKRLRVLSHSEWVLAKAEQERAAAEERSRAGELWERQCDLITELEIALADAEAEVDEAQEARMHPADTSKGITEQRERLMRAEADVAAIASELAKAEVLERELSRRM